MEITQQELKEKINNGEKLEKSEVPMYTLNVDENRELSVELGVRAIPTIKSFNGGKVVDTKVGVLQEAQLNDLVNGLING